MKNGQGKNLGWMTVKSAILKAVINGRNTREKLKADFTPHIVSTKDIDYHLRGTPNKPGLIMRGVLKEKNGILTPNLRTEENLTEILEDYLLFFPEYRKALDLEFSACFLSDMGDTLTALHDLTDEQSDMLERYYDWAGNDWPDGKRPDNINEIEEDIIKLADDLSQKTRGHLNDGDKISYIIAFYSLFASGPFQGYSDQKWWENYEGCGGWELSEVTLMWKDMNLIRESAKNAETDIIKMVFDRLHGIATRNPKYNMFPGSNIPDIGLAEAAYLTDKVMYQYIDKLTFDAGLYSFVDTIGNSFAFKREMVKIMKLQKYIPVSELERLGQILKDFNNSQKIRQSMDNVEKEIEEYYGKLL